MGEKFIPHDEFLSQSIEVPQELQVYNQFLVWKYALVDGKQRKPPYNPSTGTLASPTDPTTWGTLAQAQEALKTGHYNGLGFVFTKNDHFTGVDIDSCIDANGNLEAQALPILVTLDSYSEISPSGTGLHIITRATLPHGRKVGNLEMYSQDRYFTLTGNHLPQTPPQIADRQEAVTMLYELLTPVAKPREHSVYEHTAGDEAVLKRAIDEVKDPLFIRLFNGDTTGFTSKSNADFTFILKLLYWCNDDVSQVRKLFLKSGLVDEKTLARRGDSTYLDVSIENALKKRNK